MKLDGTRTRRHTIGLIPVSQNFDLQDRVGVRREVLCPEREASAVVSSSQITASQPAPSPDTPEILMLEIVPQLVV